MEAKVVEAQEFVDTTPVSNIADLTNDYRIENGLSVLTTNHHLTASAQAKAEEMCTLDYFGHTRPDGSKFWKIAEGKYSWLDLGENLAFGFKTDTETMTGWKNSPAHNAAMLPLLRCNCRHGIRPGIG